MIDLFYNIGTGFNFWMTIMNSTILLFWIILIVNIIRQLLDTYKRQPADSAGEIIKNYSMRNAFARLGFYSFGLVITCLFLFIGYGSGDYTKESVPIETHSLNEDIKRADSVQSNKEIEIDAINKMDKHLQVIKIDSVFDRKLKEAEEETDKELERLLK